MWLATGDMVVDLSKTFSKKYFGNSFRSGNSCIVYGFGF
jgi:hypothetical protein